MPTDLDDSICSYTALSPKHQEKFDRAAFWLDIAARQWTISVSASFAALVSAIEALTEGRSRRHHYDCPVCKNPTHHEVPGSTQRFTDFFDRYAPGTALEKRRKKMYALRSQVLHGSKLMQLDQGHGILNPVEWNESELHRELWGLTQIAIRNWLKSPT